MYNFPPAVYHIWERFARTNADLGPGEEGVVHPGEVVGSEGVVRVEDHKGVVVPSPASPRAIRWDFWSWRAALPSTLRAAWRWTHFEMQDGKLVFERKRKQG